MDSIYDPEWLAREMDRAGVRTGELAKASNVSRSQIQRIRNGSPPRLDTYAALQRALRDLPASHRPTPTREQEAA